MKNKTIFICGALGELAIEIWTNYPDNFYIFVDQKEKPKDLVNLLNNFIYIQADVRKGNELKKKVDAALKGNHIKIDAMMNTPSFNPRKLFEETSFEEIKLAYETKLLGYTNLIKVMLPYFRVGCSVVNIGSVHGQRTDPGNIVYGASNAGIQLLTKGLAVEYKHKYRFNTISPGGFLDEDYMRSHKDTWREKVKNNQLLQKEDIINIVMFLFDRKSKGINGKNIIVDQGVSALRTKSSDW